MCWGSLEKLQFLFFQDTVRLNKIKTFEMPQKNRLVGFENISKIIEKNANPKFYHRDLFKKTQVL